MRAPARLRESSPTQLESSEAQRVWSACKRLDGIDLASGVAPVPAEPNAVAAAVTARFFSNLSRILARRLVVAPAPE